MNEIMGSKYLEVVEAPKLTDEQLAALLATKPLSDEDVVGFVSTDDSDETDDMKIN